jgi:multidrug efflux pump subunit AcrA (membrane-fusion protein)
VNSLPALILVDGSRLHVDIKVDEVDIGQLKIGQSARFTLDALPGEALTGTIERIALAANQTATVTTYDVRVAVDRPGAPVRIGMTASATITVRELRDVLRVPNQFVRLDRRTNQAYVNLVNPDNSLYEIPVSLGLRTEEYSEILGGLNEGDIIGIDLNAGGFSIF